MAKKTDLDAKVLALMEDVKSRKDKLGKLSKPQWITSCSLELPGMPLITIQLCNDLTILAYVRFKLREMLQAIGEASLDLDISIDPTFKGYQLDDWLKDVEQRMRIITIKSQQDALNKLEAKLNTLTSEDQRRAFALAEIESELK